MKDSLLQFNAQQRDRQSVVESSEGEVCLGFSGDENEARCRLEVHVAFLDGWDNRLSRWLC